MSLTLNAKTTALVLIDLEHGIVGRELAPYKGKDVVQTCAGLAEAFRRAGGTVVYVHVMLDELPRLPADKPMMPLDAPRPPKQASELVPEAGYREGKDILITKRQWGAFHATSLDQQLRRLGVTTVVMAGIATNFGVESTARGAIERGYAVVFAEDAMTTMSKDMHMFATEKIFPVIGQVTSTKEIAAALR